MNIIEITDKFPTELDVVEYFEKVRWGNNPECPYCNSAQLGVRNKDLRFHCKSCQKSFSVTTKTQIHNTRLPVRRWMFAFSLITDAKKGLSALQLQRNLNVSYPTAMLMYRKSRELMAMENKDVRLDDVVEMDETFIGGKPRPQANPTGIKPKKREKLDAQLKELKEDGFEIKKGKRRVAHAVDVKRGRGTKQIPVVGIVERNGDVVAQVMRKLTYQNLKTMVEKYVDEDDSVLITDEYRGYSRMHNIIEHVKIDHHKIYSYKGLNTNTIESFWAVVERGIMGQYHHVSAKYLPSYIAEFVFKFNNRNNDDMFETLVHNSMKSR